MNIGIIGISSFLPDSFFPIPFGVDVINLLFKLSDNLRLIFLLLEKGLIDILNQILVYFFTVLRFQYIVCCDRRHFILYITYI